MSMRVARWGFWAMGFRGLGLWDLVGVDWWRVGIRIGGLG